MDYDLDLARIIVSSAIKSKTIFVVKPDEDELNISSLSEFGTVLKLGLEGFVQMVKDEEQRYTPSVTKIFSPISFHKTEVNRDVPTLKDADFYQLILNGYLDEHLAFHSLINDRAYPYLIFRSKLQECVENIKSGVHSILIESTLGNGKTILAHPTNPVE